MAIGLITSPGGGVIGSGWSLGAVVAPTWCQAVQDNQNAWITGVGVTLKALQIDGVGNNATTANAGEIRATSHVITGGSAPTFTAGAGAGTSPTLIGVGCDQAGFIQLQIGSSPASGSILCTVTYHDVFPATANGPAIALTPANSNAAGISSVNGIYINRTGSNGSTGFTLNCNGVLTASQQYSWYYSVVGT